MMAWADSIQVLREAKDEDVALVWAHQDDEALMAWALLRFRRALVVHVTDGAPEDSAEWKGLKSKEEYARLRARELKDSLDAVGHAGTRIELGFRDTRTTFEFRALRHKLAQVLRDSKVVFTHAYEGGHPDHDAIAAAVHSVRPELIIESPYYRNEGGRTRWQEFLPSGAPQYRVLLSTQEAKYKKAMIAAHKSQAQAMKNVDTRYEYYRVAPRYDFSRPPNAGVLSRNYTRAGIPAEPWKIFA